MTNIFDLSGKTIIVTGASSGLGRHMALFLAGQGARVAACARRTDLLETLADDLPAGSGEILPVAMDLWSLDSIAAAVERAESALGPVDVLVNNAGVAYQSKSIDMTERDYDQSFDTNTKGSFFAARECAARMIARGSGGSIVNIASVAALVQIPQLAVYGMSKAAVIYMTKTLAREWAMQNINVNAICPGYIETDINSEFFASEPGKKFIASMPRRRLGTLKDLEGALLLLASVEASRAITGTVIAVDNGFAVA